MVLALMLAIGGPILGGFSGWSLPQMMGMMGQMMGPMAGTNPNFSWIQFEPPVRGVPVRSLAGNGKALYMLNCAVCHGDTGKGNGWRANFLYPRPRSFTRGIFRFKTTPSGSLPTDRDLYRTISTGLQGTSMPGWGNFLTEGDRWALVAYLKTFSPYFQEDLPGQPIVLGPAPDLTVARVERGKQMFAKAGCVDCHGTTGHGDGTAAKDMEDSFGIPIRPRNFHLPFEFKRGRTLRDIAMTVHTGNDGTPMPSFHGSLTSSQVWDLASYVVSMDIEMPTLGGPGCPMMTGMPMPAAAPPPTPATQ